MCEPEDEHYVFPLPDMLLPVLNMLKEIPRSDTKQIAEVTNLSEAIVRTILDKAYTLLKSLSKQGILSLVNKGKYARYELNDK